MSSTVPQPLEGSQSPAPLELLWEKHRKKLNAVLWLLIIGMGLYYGYKYYNQKQVDAHESAVVKTLLLDNGYVTQDDDIQTLDPIDVSQLRALESATVADLEQRKSAASPIERPYVLWLIANRYVVGKDQDLAKAEAALAELEQQFPQHVLVQASKYPVQARSAEPEKKDPKKKPTANEEEKLKPAVEGSMVGLLRQQIAKAREFKAPAQFAKPEIPADAPRYRVKLSNKGEFTIAVIASKAPKHAEAFQKWVEKNFWNDIRIDEIQRPTKQTKRFPITQMHFGFESTKSDNRADWDTTKPMDKELLVDEQTGLSHFPGAIAARAGAEGKSEIQRLWVCVDDVASIFDGQRQVFAYVTDGLDVVRAVCDSAFEKLDDEKSGRGRPQETIKIESITKQ